MNRIEFGEDLGKPQAAFVIFFARDAQPWADYPEADCPVRDLRFPVCLMISRHDGSIGFIGGMSDGDETPEQTAIREVQEEIGHSISVELEPLVAHDIGSITTNAFTAEVSYPVLRTLQRDALQGTHFGSEIAGILMPHLVDYTPYNDKPSGVVRLLKNEMATSVREEMVHFLLKKDIFTYEHLEKICHIAGFTLAELLK